MGEAALEIGFVLLKLVESDCGKPSLWGWFVQCSPVFGGVCGGYLQGAREKLEAAKGDAAQKRATFLAVRPWDVLGFLKKF